MAAWAMGKIKSERAVDALIQALMDSDKIVRQWAAWALAEIFGPKGLEGKPITDLLGRASANPYLLEGVKELLHQMGILRNPEAWMAYWGSNGLYVYSTVDILTLDEKSLFQKSPCCSADSSQEHIRVLDRNKKDLIAVHTLHCPQVKEAYWQGPIRP